MKKQIAAIALIVGLSMATVASANWGRGGYGHGGGYGDCTMQGQMMQGPRMQQLDAATQAKVDQFFKDTHAMHKQIAMKRAEKQAILRSDKPDPQAVAKLTGELFDLRTELQAKAETAGVAQFMGPMAGMGGGGRGFAGPCCGQVMANPSMTDDDAPDSTGKTPQQ